MILETKFVCISKEIWANQSWENVIYKDPHSKEDSLLSVEDSFFIPYVLHMTSYGELCNVVGITRAYIK